MMILGAGYSGREIAREFLNHGALVSGTTRSSDKIPALKAIGIDALAFDGQALTSQLVSSLGSVTHLIQSISPAGEAEGTDPFLSLIKTNLRAYMPSLEWIGYLSTVGVYGDHQGNWVDETTTPAPLSKRSIARLSAEVAWQAAAQNASLPLSILRLSGIYGSGRNAFINLQQGKAKRLIKAGQYFNRIRVEDIASASRFLANQKADGIFNVTDDAPAPPQDVVTFAAGLMGVIPPPEQAFETAELTPMARSFYSENKRVSNDKIRAAGYKFTYANYRDSLKQLWDSGRI